MEWTPRLHRGQQNGSIPLFSTKLERLDMNIEKVFGAIKNGNRTGNQIFITYKDIAKVTGLQVTMVSSCIRILVSRKIIEKINHKNERGAVISNSYKILKHI